MRVVVLAGGVGAARFLRGLVEVVAPEDVTAIVNTGDDTVFHGLHVSPDLDTVTYTLAGAINPETGWGLVGESWSAMDALRRYESAGALTWFNLGDRDLATHLFRTDRLRHGDTLSTVTDAIRRAWDVGVRLLPMTDDPVSTRVRTADGVLGFQQYFVGRHHDIAVSEIILDGIESARPGADVIGAIESADAIVIAPSNPLVSIGPVLAVAGIRDALIARRSAVCAVSPIIGGAALKGPADRMLVELGHESSAVGVARLYAPFCSSLVIDTVDAALATAVDALGVRAVVTDTIMARPGVGASLAKACLAACGLATWSTSVGPLV